MRCPRMLPAGTAMADADQSSASAAPAMSSEGAAKKLESELVVVNTKILSIEASIARVESMPKMGRCSAGCLQITRKPMQIPWASRLKRFRAPSSSRGRPRSGATSKISSSHRLHASQRVCLLCRTAASFASRQIHAICRSSPSASPAGRSLLSLGARTPLACVSPAAASSLFGLHAAVLRVRVATKCQLLLYLACPHWPPLAHRVCFYPPWRRT
jgi:hypothetical protein